MSLFESISVLRHISTILSVFPIQMKHSHLLTLIYIFLFTFCLVNAAIQKPSSLNEIISGNYYDSNVISNYGLLFHIVNGTLVVYTSFVCSLLKTDSVKDTLENIRKVDETLKQLGQKFQHRRDKILINTFYFVGLLTILIIVTLQAINIHRENFKPLNPNVWSVLLFPIIISNILIVQFSFTVLAIYDRLKKINEQLRIVGDFELKQANDVINRINILLKLHDTLCTTAKQVNSNYAIQLFVTMNNQYAILLFCIFYCYWMVKIPQ